MKTFILMIKNHQLLTVAIAMSFIVIAACFLRNKNDNELVVENGGFLDGRFKPADWAICGLTAAFAALFLAFCPLNTFAYENNSSVFTYIGRQMHEGMVPYKDLFDHKGIVMYFIQWLGLAIGFGSTIGIWLIEIVHILFFAVFSLKSVKLITKNTIAQYLSVFLMCGFFAAFIFQRGNLVEEYALPWIAYALYVFMKYFITKEYKIYNIVILGAAFGTVLLLRCNMIGVWASLMPLVLLYMIKEKDWKSMGICTAGFVSGILIIFLPVLIYFILTESLGDMFECYIKFNFAYTSSRGTLISAIKAIAHSYIVWMCVLFFLFTVIPFKKQKIYWLNLFALAVSMIFTYMSGRTYAHYLMADAPMIIALASYALIWLFGLSSGLRINIGTQKIRNIILVGIAVVFSAACLTAVVPLGLSKQLPDNSIPEYIINNTAPEDDILFIGNGEICLYYIIADRATHNKFFYQFPPVEISEELREEFIEQLKIHPSDFILVRGKRDEHIESGDVNTRSIFINVDGLAQNGYYSLEEYDTFYVYKRK